MSQAQQTTIGQPTADARPALSPLLARYGLAFRSAKGRIGLALVILIGATALLASTIFPAGYDVQGRNALALPSFQAPFGTDEVGRSIFVRTIFGIGSDLSLVLVAVPIAAIAGTLLGLLGFASPVLGNLAQRCFDVVMGFPSLILGICVALVLRPGWNALVVALAIYSTPAFGRLARATLLAQQGRDYIQAARMLGVPPGRIMVRHILPHAIDTAITQTVVSIVASIVLESSLSIVGLGLQPPRPSLGVLLNSGARYLDYQPYYVLGPALVLLLLVVSLSLLSDALTRAGSTK